MRRIFFGLICCLVSGFHVSYALATTYAVVPFQINGAASYEYLSKAIPSMVSSRLFVAGTIEPAEKQDLLMSKKSPVSQAKAQELRKSIQAEYLIYGNVTIIGNQASLDMNVVGENDLFWQKPFQSSVDDMLTAVQNGTNSIRTEVFKLETPEAKTAKISRAASNSNPPNNTHGIPSFEQTSRSPMLDFESLGFEIADFDNDGKMEIAMLKSNYIYIYRYEKQQFIPLTELKLSNNISPLRIRNYRHEGINYMVFSGHNKASNKPIGQIFHYKSGELKEISRVSYYLNVAQPTLYDAPMILGQQGDATRFLRGYVFEMNFNGKDLTRGRNYSQFPKEANLYNFTWLPGTEAQGGNHLIVINNQDKMITFDSKGKRLAKTEEIYASSGVSVPISRDIIGFQSKEGSENMQYYYIPMRCIPTDFDGDGQYELLTSKPLDDAIIAFNSYRTFTQGDVQALMWDGLGMTEQWQTRRIKGTIIDIAVADPDNDGVMDLVVNVNSHSGVFGLGDTQTMLLFYPLGMANN